MLKHVILLAVFFVTAKLSAQNCIFKDPVITVHFGSGNVRDVNATSLPSYDRVGSPCPSDGHYTFVPATSDCFGGDWLTIPEDHTSGDNAGNMLLVNSSYDPGTFFTMELNGFKGNTKYEFAVWMMNLCRISDKCPFPLLPNLTIRLQTMSGETVAKFGTGDIARRHAPHWTRYRAMFTTPPSTTSLMLVMTNHAPGGCGNDLAMDDITFRECLPPPVTTAQKPPPAKKESVTQRPKPAVKKEESIEPRKPANVSVQPKLSSISDERPKVFPPPPPALTSRTNATVKQIEMEAGEIKVDLYDNGEIDGDTVTIYHNNVMIVSRARLSQKPITFRIKIDPSQPHHELVMVANNLGSIPPNTSLMIVTAGSKRYEVYISSTEQRNAKVVFDLRE